MSKRYSVITMSLEDDMDGVSFGTEQILTYEEVIAQIEHDFSLEEISDLAIKWELGELPIGEVMTTVTEEYNMKITRIEDGE